MMDGELLKYDSLSPITSSLVPVIHKDDLHEWSRDRRNTMENTKP